VRIKLVVFLSLSQIFCSGAIAKGDVVQCGPCGSVGYNNAQVCDIFKPNGDRKTEIRGCDPNTSSGPSCAQQKIILWKLINEGEQPCELAQYAYTYGPHYTSCGDLGCSSHATSTAVTYPTKLTCNGDDTGFYGQAAITIAGESIWIAFSDKNIGSAQASGSSNTDGGFFLNQGDLGCGQGANINIDAGLLNGSAKTGAATLSVLPNYGCGGGTATYDCKVQ